MIERWNQLVRLGETYGVDPRVFAVLYVAHHPLFWGTMAWLAARVRQKRPVRPLVALAVFFWLMPYLYVFAFGRGLPWWTYALAGVVLIVGGAHAAREIRRRLRASGGAFVKSWAALARFRYVLAHFISTSSLFILTPSPFVSLSSPFVCTSAHFIDRLGNKKGRARSEKGRG